jgi:DNA-binding MarR family transcriptional regulator
MTTTLQGSRQPARTALPILPQTLEPALANDARDLAEALTELIRVVQFRDRDRACCHDVSVSQCHALKGVVDAGALTVNDLAAHLFLDKSTASRVANGLVDKGLLTRERDGGDGRLVRLVATEAGRATCAAIEADLAVEYADLLTDFSPEVRMAMTRLVGRLGRSFAARVETSGGNCCVVR